MPVHAGLCLHMFELACSRLSTSFINALPVQMLRQVPKTLTSVREVSTFLTPQSDRSWLPNRSKICPKSVKIGPWMRDHGSHAQIKRKGPILASKSAQNQPQMVIPAALFTYTSTTTSRNKTQRTCMASSSRPDTYRCAHIHTDACIDIHIVT